MCPALPHPVDGDDDALFDRARPAPGHRSRPADQVAAPGPPALHTQARPAAGSLRHRLGAGRDGRRTDLLRDRGAERALGAEQVRRLADRLGRVRGHGDRCQRGRPARGPDRPPLRFRPDAADLRSRDRRLRARDGRRRPHRAALRGGARPRCRAAGRLDADERVRAGPDPRPRGGLARGVLGAGLDPRRRHRHLRRRLRADGLALGTPESVRFLEAQGRSEEAERVVRSFEAAAGIDAGVSVSMGDPQARPEAGTDVAGARAAGAGAAAEVPAADRIEAAGGIWSAPLRARTAGLWAVWFCINLSYYGAFIWIPTLLVDRGFDLTRSFTFTLVITLAQIPGYAAAAWLIEVLGRRWTLTVFLTGSAVAATCYGLADSEATIIAAGCALSFFNLGAWGALYAIGPELYPTRVRGTGTGAAAAFGRIASMLAPFLVPVFLLAGGQVFVFAAFSVFFVLAALAAFTLPEQRGKALAE